MTKPEHRALTVNDLLDVVDEEVSDFDTVVQVDIGATNNYKVIKGLQVRGGHLVILVGERGHQSNGAERAQGHTEEI